MGERQVTPKRISRRSGLLKAIILVLVTSILIGLSAGPAAARPPSCDVSGTTIDFLSEDCTVTNCTWKYKVCQTGFALSHWVLGRCPCFEGHITEVGYIDAQGNSVVLPKCSEGQTTPCWEFGLDPTTGLLGLKWDNLPGPENECWTFYFTIDQDVDETEVKWTSKFAACAPGTGNVTGPVCGCGCGEVLAFKYYDVNQNDVYDQGDYELEGWEICLNETCKLTDEMGFVDFGCLPPSMYDVCETLKTGWVNTDPGVGPPCKEVKVAAGDYLRVPFGNWKPVPPVGGEARPVSKASVLAPWAAAVALLAGGVGWYALSRRRVHS